jgi:hypothetical protein
MRIKTRMFRIKIYQMITVFLFFLTCGVFANISIVGSLTREYTVVPGEKNRGSITIHNTGEKKVRVKIYQRDYMFFCDGHSDFGEPGEGKRSNANWVRFNPTYLTVPPNEKMKINYLISTPRIRTLNGTYWSVLMIEEMPIISAGVEKRGVAINSVMRYAVQMITHMGKTGKRNLKFIGSRIVKDEDKLFLEIDLKNTGQRLLRPSLWVELYSTNGRKMGRIEGRKMRTFPNTSIRQQVDLSSVSQGKYKALVVADCGGDDVYGITYTLRKE